MKIKSINIIDGKNKWSESKDKLIHMVLDLGVYENKPSDKIEGFYERIKEYLPSLKSHRCSEGKPGGFLKRIKDGTWMGHIIEHVALELQTLAGMNTGWGRTRGVKGQKGVYNVVFNYENKDKGKLAAREAFNVVNDIIDNKNPQIDNIVKKLKPKTKLQENIRRILREDEYSPAGKEIIPNKIVIHKSNPKVRDRISNDGLKARAGECYKIYAGYGEKCIPAIFATNSTNKRAWFDSTYDDDIWAINTEMIPDVKWYKDRHFDSTKKHIVTFDNIPPEAIELMREGTGDDMIRESNDKLIKETKTFQEIINKTLNEIKNICELPDIDTFPDWLSFDDCDVVDTIDKITIVNIEKINGISTIPMFEIDVKLELNGIWGGIDYEDFMYSIFSRIISKWKIRLIFNIKEQENSNKREMREGTGDDMIKETKTFQDIVNKTINEIKNICGDEDNDTFPDWFSGNDCEGYDSIDKITIVNIEKRNGVNTIPMFEVDVKITFNSIFEWIDYEDFMYLISDRIVSKWKTRFIFNIIEQDNINKREMWESVKHKNINKSKFFHRRVDLNDVEKLLPINSRQIFYETESYEQFKYEITLRAVESIMYNEYGMGYEDLPEEEEIDFVTEVSDIFEDIIKDTYDYFNNL